MKFETYVYEIVIDHQPNFHKDACKDAHAQVINARTCISTRVSVFMMDFYKNLEIIGFLNIT